MKSLIITGTLITKDTAAGYIERMCAYCFGDAFDMAACTMLVEIKTRIVNAGLITWEEIGKIEEPYYSI